MWAVATRSDPVRDIDFIQRAWGSQVDPQHVTLPDGGLLNSRAIVDACRPYESVRFPAHRGGQPGTAGPRAGEVGRRTRRTRIDSRLPLCYDLVFAGRFRLAARGRVVVMIVGVMQLSLVLPASESLKDKRQVVKSVLARVRNRFNVAAAEVDSLDHRQFATLGFCCVSNEGRHAEQQLAQVLAYTSGLDWRRRSPTARSRSFQSRRLPLWPVRRGSP